VDAELGRLVSRLHRDSGQVTTQVSLPVWLTSKGGPPREECIRIARIEQVVITLFLGEVKRQRLLRDRLVVHTCRRERPADLNLERMHEIEDVTDFVEACSVQPSAIDIGEDDGTSPRGQRGHIQHRAS
jgi:hypothetical protein